MRVSLKTLLILLSAGLLLIFVLAGIRQHRWVVLSAGQLAEQVTVSPSPALSNLQDSFIAVAERVKPSVVNINTVYVEKYTVPEYEFYFGSPFDDFLREFFGYDQESSPGRRPRFRQYQQKYEGIGSGVIIDEQGYVLTNEHVIRQATEIKVTLVEGGQDRVYRAELVGKDVQSDLAVIKIKASRKFPYARMGDSDKIRVGEWVVAIGSPFGLEQTVTAGVISAKRQSLMIENRQYRDLIQTDAAINRGNSGGPLLNLAGEVIGINTAIFAPTGVFNGIGFAIPINRAKEILQDLISRGKVIRGWLGVEIQPVNRAISRGFGLDKEEGVLINRVLANSPAARAGLKRGDILIEFAGKKVNSVTDLQNLVSAQKPGTEVVAKIWRERKILEKNIKIGEMPAEIEGSEKEEKPEEEKVSGEFNCWGAKFSEVSPGLLQKYNLASDATGIIAIEVPGNSLAADMGLLEGDLIMGINQKPVNNISDFRRLVKEIDLKAGIVLDINRAGRLVYLSYSE